MEEEYLKTANPVRAEAAVLVIWMKAKRSLWSKSSQFLNYQLIFLLIALKNIYNNKNNNYKFVKLPKIS
jgi:hypothetical protein